MTPAATPELEKAEREFREAKQLLQDSDTNMQKASLKITNRASIGPLSIFLQNETTNEREMTLNKLEQQVKKKPVSDLPLSKNLLVKK